MPAKKKVKNTKKEVKKAVKKLANKKVATVKKKPAIKTKTKAKTAKKSDTKKTTAKKVAKKTAVKKTTTKKTVAKKSSTKKAVKKTTTKRTVKKVVNKKPAKAKSSNKKTISKSKTVKEPTKKVEKKSSKKVTGLAKAILSKTAKNSEETLIPVEEKKNDLQQKIIIARKTDGKNKITFKVGDYTVYPSHGIGKIIEIEKTEVLGQDFSCYLMFFEREKLTIKIPVNSAEKIGLRKLVSKSQMEEVFSILRSGVKKLKGMWSRRAQEYETKINSGDIVLLAEVIRDLTRDIEDAERSYSERIIYETAIYRLASEYAAIHGIDFEDAKDQVITTAKDKLNSEERISQKDDFDDFDLDDFDSDEEEDDDDEDSDDEDDDFDYDDDDFDEKPRRKRG